VPIIPWRAKAFLSNHFPLAYHLAVNAGVRGNSQEHWDRMLERSWNDAARAWPTKVECIRALTTPAHSILDLACGTGSILRALRQHGYADLHALEISAYAVARLQAEGIEARQGVLPRIAYPDQVFDIVIASQVLEHVIRRSTFAEEIRRVLKPGGRAFIFVPDRCLGPIDEPEHVIVYDAASLERFLARRFHVDSIESMRDANHDMPILFARVRR
jgi:SAM-dependent methyltransferase